MLGDSHGQTEPVDELSIETDISPLPQRVDPPAVLDVALDEYGLGRLGVLPSVRNIWPKEASDFTPWLYGNLDLLGEAIGLPLTPEGMEHPIGGYRLDILAKDSLGHHVAIENQVEPADHSHLGQLLLYAAHVDADTAIWIAPRFSDEHRQALIWLNESTTEGIRFFGVEVSVVHIGASPPAPVFNVIVRPNDIQKADPFGGPTEPSEAALARRDFMTQVLTEVHQRLPIVRVPTGASYTNSMTFRSGPFGTYSIVFTRDQRLRVEAYLDSSQEVNRALFDELHNAKESWEAKLGFALKWERLNGAKASRLGVYLDFWLPGGEASIEQAREWAISRIVSMVTCLDSTLRTRASALRSQQGAE